MAQIADLKDFINKGAPADIGLFEKCTTVIVFQFNFSGNTYTCSIGVGVGGWVPIALSVQGNDDVEIQAAIQYLIALGGGRLFIQRGNYDIVNVLLVQDAVDLEIYGAGWGTKLIAAGENTLLRIGDRAGDHPSQRIYIGHLYFDGSNQSVHVQATRPEVDDTGIGIEIAGDETGDITIADNYIYNTGNDSIYGYSPSEHIYAPFNIIMNNYVRGTRGYWAGIHAHVNYHPFMIIGNVLSDMDDHSVSGIRHGRIISGNRIWMAGGFKDGTDFPSIMAGDQLSVVTSNDIYNSYGKGIMNWDYAANISHNNIYWSRDDAIYILNADQAEQSLVHGNNIHYPEGVGILVDAGITVNVSNNNIFRAWEHGIEFNGTDISLIEGNLIIGAGIRTDATYHGIYLHDITEDNEISDNIIYSAEDNRTLHGIFIDGGSDNTLRGNKIRNLDGDAIRLNDSSGNLLGLNYLKGNAGFGVNLLGNSDYNRIAENYTKTNVSGCANINAATCNNNVLTNNNFDEGNIANAGTNTRAWLNYDPSANAFIVTINPPTVVGGGGGVLP